MTAYTVVPPRPAPAGARLVSPDELPRYVGKAFSAHYLRKLEAAGLHPRRVYLTDKAYAYVESELIAWAEARIAERDAPTPALIAKRAAKAERNRKIAQQRERKAKPRRTKRAATTSQSNAR